MRYTVLLLLLLLLGACAKVEPPQPVAQDVPLSTKQVTSVTHEVEGGQVVVLQIPVGQLKKATERQTCYVWRDKINGGTSFQCPNDRQSYSVDPP